MATKDQSKALTPKLRFPEFRDGSGWDAINGNKLFDLIDRRPAPSGLPILAITQEHGAVPRDHIDYHVSVSETSVASYKEVQPTDFIISLRSFQGGIEYSCFHGICSPAYLILKRNGDGSDDYFRHLFKSDRFIQQLTRNIEGLRDGKMISYKQFSEQLLPTPSPAEQRKIAACLTSLDELLAAEGQKLAALRAHKKGLMQQLFPREGESRPRLRFPDFRDAGEWETKPLSTFIAQLDTGVSVLAGDRPAANGEVGVLKTSCVAAGLFNPSENKVVSDPVQVERVEEPVRADTILISRMNTVALVGANAYVDRDYDNLYLPDRLWAVKGTSRVNMRFLAYLIGSDRGRRDLSAAARGSSGSMKNISKPDVLGLQISAPDVAEQQRIAACLGSLDEVIAAASQKLQRLRAHKKGLMQRLFPSSQGE